MRLTFIVLAAFMATAAPVFAEEPEFINYKIKIDRSESFEADLEKNRELLRQLKGNTLFSNWTKDGSDIPKGAKDAYKKPAFHDNVVEGNKETDYIKCVKGIVTK